MKVLMITSRADIGGGPIHLLQLMQAISNDVELYLASPIEGDLSNDLKEYAREYFTIPYRSFSLINFIKLYFWIKTKKIDIIHSHGKGAGIYSRLLGVLGMKVVHTFHGLHIEDGTKGKMNLFLEKILAPFGMHYIFCSNDEKKIAKIKSLRLSNSSVVYNSVLTNNHVDHVLNQNIELIGFIARNDSVKNYKDFFKSVKLLSEKHPKLKFLVAGSSAIDFEGQYQIPRNVEFLGSIKNTDIFYSKIDLLISHSKNEGLPLTILEALSNKVPCLISRVNGHYYFMENNVAQGFELGNMNSFIQNFEMLCKFEYRKQIVERGYKFILENHSLNLMKRTILKIYESVL